MRELWWRWRWWLWRWRWGLSESEAAVYQAERWQDGLQEGLDSTLQR